MPWDLALILAFLAIAVPLLGRRRIRRLLASPSTTARERLALYFSTILSQWAAVGIILWRSKAHGISSRQLGWTIPHLSLVITVAVILASLILLNQLLSLRHLASDPAQSQKEIVQLALRIFPQDNWELLAFAAVVATVAICEELIYRGFVQGLMSQWSGRAWIGIVLASLLFGIAHLYQGIRGVSSTLVVGIIFSTIRWWTGSLLPPILAHFVADLTAGIVAPRRLRHMNPETASTASTPYEPSE